ncbi:unnamed protein product [Adineta steineri]|uniref:Uncharacterized protein n=1 Tax=Adineta steineri TaxID=433720 RepID=A0A814AJH7_9BILA|nr:unnamed protein product [Adineta steineri]
MSSSSSITASPARCDISVQEYGLNQTLFNMRLKNNTELMKSTEYYHENIQDILFLDIISNKELNPHGHPSQKRRQLKRCKNGIQRRKPVFLCWRTLASQKTVNVQGAVSDG